MGFSASVRNSPLDYFFFLEALPDFFSSVVSDGHFLSEVPPRDCSSEGPTRFFSRISF